MRTEEREHAVSDALAYALGDLEAMPPEAPKHVREEVGRWAVREFNAGRVQSWLAERFAPDEWPEAVAGELRHAAWLIGRSARRPHLRVTRWAQLLEWTSDLLDDLEPQWDERTVLHRFADRWTVELVRTDSDLDLEGRLMRHCLNAERGQAAHAIAHDAIASLRDPAGRPHVTLIVGGGAVMGIGRSCSRLKSALADRVAEYANAAGLVNG